MPADLQPLSAAQIGPSTQTWLDHLGRVNAERLSALLPLFETGEASLASALQVIAPGKDRVAALAAYQTFVVRANEAAREANLELAIKVDTQKKADPEIRKTWIEGPSPDVANLAQFTREAVSTIEGQDLVPPAAAILNQEEQEHPEKIKPLIRFFVSYAHADRERVTRLQDSLEKELALIKDYRFEIWSDKKIEVGADWDERIQTALKSCDFGLLFVSRDFLLSRYITGKELPPFVTGTKPVIPVGLTPLVFDRIDMKGLEVTQIYRLQRDSGEPRFYSQCTGHIADEFAQDLAGKILEKIKSSRKPTAPKAKPLRPSRTPEPFPLDDAEVAHAATADLGHHIVLNNVTPECPVDPHGANVSLQNWEKDASQLEQNRTKAVDFLADWAIKPEGTPFCAVLGETGIGKTTTLMLLAEELERRREQDATVPAVIFIDLKDYYFENDPVLEDILRVVISRHWKGDAGRAITPEMIIRAVRERGALIIFDGLDERIIPLPQGRRDAFIRQLWSVLPPLSQKPKPGTRPGRLIISCRSHYFPTITALSSAFTGEDREGIRQQDYTACVILPFNDAQVRAYLGKMLGEERVEEAVGVIRSVHNLTDLSTRPFLLSLIAPELNALEQMKAAGRTVLGVTLYGLFVEKWLRRDEYKHQFTPEHKLQMMEALAAHLCRINQKTLPWAKVSKWLDSFLAAHPEIRDRYQDKPAEVLNQDFRAATFCLRPDGEKDGFRFAHTSLYEYFLALHLVRAWEEDRPADWDLPLPSDETLDFAGQLLAEGEKIDPAAAVAQWTRWLDDGSLPANTRRNAFRAWIVARCAGWPQPSPVRAALQNLDLEGWVIGTPEGPRFDLRHADLSGSRLDHADIHCALLTGAHATGLSARLAELHGVDLVGADFEGADLCGGTWRGCDLRGLRATTAVWHDCDVIASDLAGAALPADWSHEAASVQVISDEWQLSLRQGHSGNANSVAWSPDGTRLVSGGTDGSVRVWDAASGRALLALEQRGNTVCSVAWSPDGTLLVSGSQDGTVRVWDVAAGRALFALDGHLNGVNSVAWSPDGARLVSGGYDGAVRVWDAASGRAIIDFEGHAKWVGSVAWSPDGARLVSGGDDGTVRVWEAASGRALLALEGHGQWVGSVAWSPDGTQLASGDNDGTVRVWDTASGRALLVFNKCAGWVNSVAWSPDGSRLVSGGYDATIRVWDAASGRTLHAIEGHWTWINSLSWSPDGARLVSGGDDATVRVWDAASGRPLFAIEGHRQWVNSLGLSPDGTQLVSGGEDGTVRVWDAARGRAPLAIEGHRKGINSVSWSPDGAQLVSGGDDGIVRSWDAGSGRALLALEGRCGWVWSVSWSPDGARLVYGGDDGMVRVWDAASGQALLTFEAHEDRILSVAWSPDGARLVSGGEDGKVRVWDAASGLALLALDGHGGWVGSVGWSPDGAQLVSGGGDGIVRVWEAASGRVLLALKGHGQGVNSVAWSPDGARLVSGGGDGTVRVWDAASGRAALTLEGHGRGVRSVAWSPDGARLVSGGADGTLREWDANSGEMIRSWVIGNGETALVDFPGNRVLHASSNAWRLLGWRGWDAQANRNRLLPAEIFGPLPPW
ncbi:MAG: TIR domain-containing protein [Verrucomicrobiales bacterium]|nr:TIR domain-containing protein [Verrucomicrobiales bacterium]